MAIEYMTQAGYDKLKKDLADALAQRPVISAAIAEAREKGDLSENAEYDAARDAQGLLEVKIARLKEKVANARVIDESKLSPRRTSPRACSPRPPRSARPSSATARARSSRRRSPAAS